MTCVQIAAMEMCVLNPFNPFSTDSLNSALNPRKKLYRLCNIYNKYILHWSKALALFRLNNTGVKVLLPGFYKEAVINISRITENLSQSNQFSHLNVRWHDTNIFPTVNKSFQLNGKQYQIFTPIIFSNEMYTWTEAEHQCIKHGSHLPSISSQSDVQNLVHILLIAVWTGPIRMIYIGLKVNISNVFCTFRHIFFLFEIDNSHIFFQNLTWLNSSPLAYQLWRNLLMRDNKINYYIESIHPWMKLHYRKKHRVQQMQMEKASKFIQPMKRDIFLCTIMVLENLAALEWISVSCNDAVVSEVVCVKENNPYIPVKVINVPKLQKTRLTIFSCSDGESISSSRHCNGVNDCTNNVDEANCFCFVDGKKVDYSHFCKHFCQHPTCICHKLLFQGNYPGCHVFEYKNREPIRSLSPFIANNITDLSHKLLSKQRHCYQDQLHMYFMNQKCIYKLDEDGNLETCRNGKHLEECTHFNCESVGKYKCPGYYCIPMAYVCDGKVDCPRAMDEYGCKNYNCKNLFHCLNTIQCIYITDVCNGVQDCPYGDDEINCILNEYICIENCTCQIFAISCRFIHQHFSHQLTLMSNMFLIFIIGNSFLSDFTWFSYLYQVTNLNLHNFKLPDICRTFHQSF